MKYLPLVWAGLWRKRVRTLLTMLSVAIAFLLFGLLDGVTAGFDYALTRLTDGAKLRTASRTNIQNGLPLSYRARIASVPGVREVGPWTFFAGYYRDPANDIDSFALDIEHFSVTEDVVVDPASVEAMRTTRTGAIVGPELMSLYGWKVGDRVTLKSRVWTQANGSSDWTFDIVGTYSVPEGAFPADDGFWINHDYLDEARTHSKGTVTLYGVRIDDAAHAATISAAIDALFANSADETLTQAERDYFRAQIDRVGNIAFIVGSIIVAVLFALLFVTANTMMQSIRERTPELAVLKTYGFGDFAVAALVVAESALLCLTSAAAGLAVAAALFPTMFAAMGAARLPLDTSTIVLGAAIAAGFALVSALLPVWRAQRLRLVDALAGR
jgi:putative ABC transport system permease protein